MTPAQNNFIGLNYPLRIADPSGCLIFQTKLNPAPTTQIKKSIKMNLNILFNFRNVLQYL